MSPAMSITILLKFVSMTFFGGSRANLMMSRIVIFLYIVTKQLGAESIKLNESRKAGEESKNDYNIAFPDGAQEDARLKFIFILIEFISIVEIIILIFFKKIHLFI